MRLSAASDELSEGGACIKAGDRLRLIIFFSAVASGGRLL